MDKKFTSIIEGLLDYAPAHNTDLFIESRGIQVIASALNVIAMIKENYSPEEADDLMKRLVRSIASGDEEKFRRRIRAIREARSTTRKRV